MRRIEIAESDVLRVAEDLSALTVGVRASLDPAWSRPVAIRVVDCVLSLNRNYDRFVVPRVEALMRSRPGLQSVAQLVTVMASHPSAHEFVKSELSYDHADRARVLAEVVGFVSGLVRQAVSAADELVTLERWATSAKPDGFRSLNIKGFKLAGYQYLRMLFGARTTKPDKHIINFVSEAVGRRVSDLSALLLLDAAASRMNVPLRDVDTSIWELRARGDRS